AVLGHETISEMVRHAIDLARLTGFGPLTALVVEDNDSLGMLVAEFTEQVARRGILLPVQGVRNTVNKVVRIRRLGVYLGRQRIRFRNTPGARLLVDQLRDFPQAERDDGPDAAELGIRYLEMLTNPT